VTTRLFYIENLIWLCLKEVIESAGAKTEITLTLQPHPEGAAVIFSPVDSPITNRNILNLLDYMKAAQSNDSKQGELIIMLPVDMTAC
jgi:hypothetical protein